MRHLSTIGRYLFEVMNSQMNAEEIERIVKVGLSTMKTAEKDDDTEEAIKEGLYDLGFEARTKLTSVGLMRFPDVMGNDEKEIIFDGERSVVFTVDRYGTKNTGYPGFFIPTEEPYDLSTAQLGQKMKTNPVKYRDFFRRIVRKKRKIFRAKRTKGY